MQTYTIHPAQDENLTVIQSRAEMSYSLVDEYAEMMKRGVEFAPILTIFDRQENHHYVYDGAHRVEAARKIADHTLAASCTDGTQADAQWLALSANQKHGLRRNTDDKQRVARNALKHPNGAALSNREIGRHCGIDHKTVGKLRKELELSGVIPRMEERTVTRNGTTYTQSTKPTPAYASIPQLEKGIRNWFRTIAKMGHTVNPIEILKQIESRSKDHKKTIRELVVSDVLPGPRRKRDVIEACNNVLDQMQQAQQLDEHLTPLICINCGEQTIRPKPDFPHMISCTTCSDEWNSIEAFELDKAAYNEICKNIDPIPHAEPCPNCESTIYYGQSASISCHNCTAHWPTEEALTAKLASKLEPETPTAYNQYTLRKMRDATCPSCNEPALAPTDEYPIIQCTRCKATWPNYSVLRDIIFKKKTTCAAHAYDPATWVDQYTQGICPDCLRTLGQTMIRTADTIHFNHQPKENKA